MYPVDCSGFVFYPLACLGVVLHDLPGTDFSIDVDLPKNNLVIFCGSQGIVFYCGFDFLFRKIVAEKAYEVGVVGC